MATDDSENLSADLLNGAAEIAEFLFGSRDVTDQKRVYYLAKKGKAPIFTLGTATLRARKSTLRAYIAEQERASQSAA